MLAHAVIPGPEACVRGQVDAGRKSRRRKMGAARLDLVDSLLARPYGIEPERDIEPLGEAAGELVGRAFGTVTAEVVRVWAVTRDHTQLACREDAFQQRGRLRAGREQQRGDHGDQELHAALRHAARAWRRVMERRCALAIECAAACRSPERVPSRGSGEVPKRS